MHSSLARVDQDASRNKNDTGSASRSRISCQIESSSWVSDARTDRLRSGHRKLGPALFALTSLRRGRHAPVRLALRPASYFFLLAFFFVVFFAAFFLAFFAIGQLLVS
jgi:hypothetical protein